MALATFKIGKKEFVIVPRRRYEQLSRAEQDQKDAEIARKANEAFLRGKLTTITHQQFRVNLGL